MENEESYSFNTMQKIQCVTNEDPLNMQFSYEKNYICIKNAKAIRLRFFPNNFCSHFWKESMFRARYETLALFLFISGMH